MLEKNITIFHHLQAIALLPFMVTIVIPSAIVYLTASMNFAWSLSVPLNWLLIGLGIIFIGLGLTLMFKTINLFATVGQGTLAPWNPPQKFVAIGIYQYVRNPMISGVICILLGETIISGSIPLLFWSLFFIIVQLIYIRAIEEADLLRRFGDDYILYKQNVPPWIPRFTPWKLEEQ